MSPDERVEIVEPLRGIAALAVVWFHFAHVSKLFENTGGVQAWIKATGEYGWLGVEVFFVISGFVLPYAMHRGGYRWSNLPTFVVKRIVRLDPPYLVNILIALSLAYLASRAPGFRGEPFAFEWPQLLCHLGYLNAIVDYGWYNPVYWTLAIEFQYYLLLALTFPLLVHNSSRVRFAFPVVLAACAHTVPAPSLVIHWLGLFAVGMLTFQSYCGFAPWWSFWVRLALISAINLSTLGVLVTGVGVAVPLTIAFVRIRPVRPLVFLGTISYSLYLIHVPIGSRFINLGTRFAETLAERIVVLHVSLVISIGSAYLLYLWVERPAQAWSKSLTYRNQGRRKRLLRRPKSHIVRSPNDSLRASSRSGGEA